MAEGEPEEEARCDDHPCFDRELASHFSKKESIEVVGLPKREA